MSGSVPPTLLASLELAPLDRPVALLLRHAQRPPIQAGTWGNEVPLTLAGIRAAEELGAAFRQRQPGRLISSPWPRCMQTAAALRRGAGWQMRIAADRRLGDPGAFIADDSLAGEVFLQMGVEEFVRRQLEGPPPPGTRPAAEGVSLLLDLAHTSPGGPPALDILVTHDSLIAMLIGFLFRMPLRQADWPAFLEGIFIWERPGGLGTAWRGEVRDIAWPRR